MPEFKKEIKTFQVDYICDNCGSPDVKSTGVTLLSNPPQYPHTCKNCGANYVFKCTYPTMKYVVIDNSV